MLSKIIRMAPGRVDVCGVSIEEELIPYAQRGTIEKLAYWTNWADKVS